MLKLRNLNHLNRGKENWKFNNSLIECNEFRDEIQAFWKGWQIHKLVGTSNMLEWWNIGKIKLKEIAIKYSKRQAKQKALAERV